MRLLIANLICLLAITPLCAQSAPTNMHLALLEHDGSLTLEKGSWEITETSAKPNGNEIGIRAKQGDLQMLAFLFVWSDKAPLTSAGCRDNMLQSEHTPAKDLSDKQELAVQGGVKVALVAINPTNEPWHHIRAFAADGDLCADITFSSQHPISLAEIKPALESLQFDPKAAPGFKEALLYATILWDHRQLDGAAKAYEVALSRVDTSDNPSQWRRVVVDQLAMSYGIAGNLKRSREINHTAIVRDPDYPLYYYNLACADAEEGNASAAQQHLQQAFDRRANTLPGEKFPDPATDDSFLKLKGNKQFWAFVQSISAQEKN